MTSFDRRFLIERVETYPLLYRLPQAYGDANGYKRYRSTFLVRIITRAGIDGWGKSSIGCRHWTEGFGNGSSRFC